MTVASGVNGIGGHRLAITFFDNYAAASKHEEVYDLPSLASRISTVTKSRKADLPWLKCAKFGDKRTNAHSLRHDANVLTITGVEADYDGGRHTVDRIVRGSFALPNWSACFLGGMQPGPIQRIAKASDDDGMLQRLIYIVPGEALLSCALVDYYQSRALKTLLDTGLRDTAIANETGGRA